MLYHGGMTTGTDGRYDVIIAGASFAGLAVAAQLAGERVLLLDARPIGEGQTSACAAPLATLRAFGLDAAVEQVHSELVVHAAGRTWRYGAIEPYATFDYARACQLLMERSGAAFLQMAALGLSDGAVATEMGPFRARLVVDATGWRAVLARSLDPRLARQIERRIGLSFGIEVNVPYPRREGLHFAYGLADAALDGMVWIFPAGERARIGLGSYRGRSALGGELERLLAHLGLEEPTSRDGGTIHGGYFPHALRPATVGDLFLVGDAAGQCLPLTGEGIRQALYFGTHLGRLLCETLHGERTLAEAQAEYVALVMRRRAGYRWLGWAQALIPRLPRVGLRLLGDWAARPRVQARLTRAYREAFRV
jgi:flavin-dependent dehydrogenase